MKNYDLFLPSYCIGNNVYRKVKDTCKEYGIKAVVIGGYRGIEAAKKSLFMHAMKQEYKFLILYGMVEVVHMKM